MRLPSPVSALLLIGPTGAGKTPLGEYIEQRGVNGRRCFHFDFGQQLRGIAEKDIPPPGFHQEEHSFIREVLGKGLLLEDEHFHIAAKIFRFFLESRGVHQDDMLVLNGLPRHPAQARDMENLVQVKSIVILECSADDVFGRIQCNTGKDREGRVDDSIGMIRKKLEIYELRTSPLVNFYEERGRTVIRLNVVTSSRTEDVYNNFLALSFSQE